MKQGSFMRFDREDRVGILTLDRPPLNILGMEFYAELAEFQQLIGMEEIRALVIEANGDHFSAGIDLGTLKQVDSEYIMQNLTWMQKLYGHWQDLGIPVVAAIHGLCLGSGSELILGCDIRIAAENARFAFPEVSFGLSPDMGGTARLTRLVGVGQAKRLLLGCEQIDAAEAARIGLVELVVPTEQLHEKALAFARKVAEFPHAAVNFAKKGVNLTAEGGVYAGLLFEQAQSTYCCGSGDKNEALAAFLEKRKPRFE